MTDSPKLVCFDLGGVLVRIVSSLAEACARAGVRAPPTFDGPLALEWQAANEAYMAGKVTLAELAARFSARSGGALTPAEIEAAIHHWIIGELPGARTLVEDVRRNGIRTTCLSNTCLEHWATLAALPSVAALDHHILSFQVGVVKPAPAIFAHVESTLGLAGGAIGYIDDVASYVDAAQARGWRAAQVTSAEDPVGEAEDVLRRWGVL